MKRGAAQILFVVVELRGNLLGRATHDAVVNEGTPDKFFRDRFESIEKSTDDPRAS